MFALIWRQFRDCRGAARCLLLALFLIGSAAPAAAGTIGYFSFERQDFFQYFSLENNAAGSLEGLIFSAVIQIDGVDYDYQFIDPEPPIDPDTNEPLPRVPVPIGSNQSVISDGFAPWPFTDGGKASLVFNIENPALYPGTLSLSNLLYEYDPENETAPPSFSATVEYSQNGSVAVTEAPSWLVAFLAVAALAAGRVLLA
jgi:hypothetical protein